MPNTGPTGHIIVMVALSKRVGKICILSLFGLDMFLLPQYVCYSTFLI